LVPPDVEPLPQTLRAIASADLITIGPGSLFTSLIPNVLVRGIPEAILESPAVKVFICNLMTQANESLGLTAADHICALNRHAGVHLFDYALINRKPASPEMKAKYALEGASQIVADLEAIERLNVCPLLGDYLDEGGAAPHESIARLCIRASQRSVSGHRFSDAERTQLKIPFRGRTLSRTKFAVYWLNMAKTPNTKNQLKSNPQPPRIAIAIMAAGKGTRLKSKHPKVLHEIGGKPILAHVIATAQEVVPAQDIFVIIGHEAERVRGALAGTGVNFVVQAEQRGTGHALMAARDALSGKGKGKNYDQVIVLSGDAPLITVATIKRLSEFHIAQKAAMTLLSADLDNPYGYGRVVRKGAAGRAEVQAIVEEKSTTPGQKKIREINSGFYAFATPTLYENID